MLLADPSVECFSLDSLAHYIYMLAAGIAIVLFYPLATMLIPTFQFMNKGLDIKFDASFITLEKQSDLFVAILSTFYADLNTLFVLIAKALICIVLAGYNYKSKPCLVSYMNPAKTILYVVFAYDMPGYNMANYKKSMAILLILLGVLGFAVICWLLYEQRTKIVETDGTVITNWWEEQRKEKRKEMRSRFCLLRSMAIRPPKV